MRFVLNREKAAQAAAQIVKLHGGKINLMVLIKLLYLADRTTLIETGSPITGDQMVSMPHGPVLSQILDAINFGTFGDDNDSWSRYISDRDGYNLSLTIEDPSNEELSDYEVRILTQIHDQYGHLTPFQLRDLTHNLPEWKDPMGGSLPIDPVTVLESAGKSREEILENLQQSEELYFLDTILSKSHHP